jgi:uncharacterized protein (TIGR00255 family)
MHNGPLRSMTGFGEAEVALPGGRLRVEIRSVNHRFLNLQLRSPVGFERLQAGIERVLREHFTRGHLSVVLSWERAEEAGVLPPVVVDLPRAKALHGLLISLADELGLEGGVRVEHLLHFRDLFQSPDRDPILPELEAAEVEAVVKAAALQVLAHRSHEGARLGADLESRLQIMAESCQRISELAPDRLVRERDRLGEAILRLLPEGVPLDEDRLAREIAHLAERWDIHEEIVRFQGHLELFRETLHEGSAEGVGKRLGFLTQEILREANTMGSKANDQGIARAVVALKEEIERIREQLENLE